jgi:hypothetical protein
LYLDVGFLLYPVDVLVQPVQQEGQELLAVVLLVATELGRKRSNLGLENARRHTADTSLGVGVVLCVNGGTGHM